jgi:hypothetical protein
MKTKLFAAVSALAILGVIGFAGIAGAREPAKTKVTIHYSGDGFFGKLKSSRGKCVRDRKVKVFKIKHGEAEKQYSDISDDDGHWDTGNSGQVSGRFFARTRKISGCKRGRSDTIHT